MRHALIFLFSNSEVIKNKGKLNALPDYAQYHFDEKNEGNAVLDIIRFFRKTFDSDRKIAIGVLESAWTDETVQGQPGSAVKELRGAKSNEEP